MSAGARPVSLSSMIFARMVMTSSSGISQPQLISLSQFCSIVSNGGHGSAITSLPAVSRSQRLPPLNFFSLDAASNVMKEFVRGLNDGIEEALRATISDGFILETDITSVNGLSVSGSNQRRLDHSSNEKTDINFNVIAKSVCGVDCAGVEPATLVLGLISAVNEVAEFGEIGARIEDALWARGFEVSEITEVEAAVDEEAVVVTVVNANVPERATYAPTTAPEEETEKHEDEEMEDENWGSIIDGAAASIDAGKTIFRFSYVIALVLGFATM